MLMAPAAAAGPSMMPAATVPVAKVKFSEQNITAGALEPGELRIPLETDVRAAVDSGGSVALDLEASGRPIRLLRNPEPEVESASDGSEAELATAHGAHGPGAGAPARPRAHVPDEASGRQHPHAHEAVTRQDPETELHRRGMLHRAGRLLSDAVGQLVDDFRSSVLLELGYQRELGYPAPPRPASVPSSLLQVSDDAGGNGVAHGAAHGARNGRFIIDKIKEVGKGVLATGLGLSSYGGIQVTAGGTDYPFLCICDAEGMCKDSCGSGDITAEGACSDDPSKSFCKARSGTWNGAPLAAR